MILTKTGSARRRSESCMAGTDSPAGSAAAAPPSLGGAEVGLGLEGRSGIGSSRLIRDLQVVQRSEQRTGRSSPQQARDAEQIRRPPLPVRLLTRLPGMRQQRLPLGGKAQ